MYASVKEKTKTNKIMINYTLRSHCSSVHSSDAI